MRPKVSTSETIRPSGGTTPSTVLTLPRSNPSGTRGPEMAARSDLEVLAPLQPWTFDAAGNLDAEADLLHAFQH